MTQTTETTSFRSKTFPRFCYDWWRHEFMTSLIKTKKEEILIELKNAGGETDKFSSASVVENKRKENGGGFVPSLPHYPACNVLAYIFVVHILLQKLGMFCCFL